MRDLFAKTQEVDDDKPINGVKADDANLGAAPMVYKSNPKNFEKRIAGEIILEDALPWHFNQGEAYHVFAYGNVASVSFLRHILKQQPLEFCSISSLSMSKIDLDILQKWTEKKLIGHLDLYAHQFVGTQQMTCYGNAFEIAGNTGGRVGLLRNHSKVVVGFGERFDFVIEGSANLCSNGNCEQVVITIDSDLARFYKEQVFDQIKPINQDFPNWEPYKLKRDEIF